MVKPPPPLYAKYVHTTGVTGYLYMDKVMPWYSGMATLSPAYQMIAENGIQSCQGTRRMR